MQIRFLGKFLRISFTVFQLFIAFFNSRKSVCFLIKMSYCKLIAKVLVIQNIRILCTPNLDMFCSLSKLNLEMNHSWLWQIYFTKELHFPYAQLRSLFMAMQCGMSKPYVCMIVPRLEKPGLVFGQQYCQSYHTLASVEIQRDTLKLYLSVCVIVFWVNFVFGSRTSLIFTQSLIKKLISLGLMFVSVNIFRLCC